MLARCPAVHSTVAECGSFAELAVSSNVALLGHNRCITRLFCRLIGDATVNSFSLVKKMKSTAYDVYLPSNLLVMNRMTHSVHNQQLLGKYTSYAVDRCCVSQGSVMTLVRRGG